MLPDVYTFTKPEYFKTKKIEQKTNVVCYVKCVVDQLSLQ